jgi:hypothetical protein
MGIGFGKIISGIFILIVPLILLLTPLSTFVNFLPAGIVPPEALGLVSALLSGKTIVDLPVICDAVVPMAAAMGTDISGPCGLVSKYVPLFIYALYGAIAIGVLMIIWGLSPLFRGKKKDSHPPEQPEA